MFERFSGDARAVVIAAQEAARAAGNQQIRAIHLLIGLGGDGRSVGDLLTEHRLDPDAVQRWNVEHQRGTLDVSALLALGIDLDAVRTSAEATFGPGALEDDPPVARRWSRRARLGHRPFTDGAKKSLQLSLRETVRLGGQVIGSEAVLLGVLRADDREVRRLFADLGVDAIALRRTVEHRLRRAA